MTLREKVARAIVQANEQNGGPPWEWYFGTRSRTKHSLSGTYDEADAAIAVVIEQCAKVAEGKRCQTDGDAEAMVWNCACSEISAAIRSLGERHEG